MVGYVNVHPNYYSRVFYQSKDLAVKSNNNHPLVKTVKFVGGEKLERLLKNVEDLICSVEDVKRGLCQLDSLATDQLLELVKEIKADGERRTDGHKSNESNDC